MQKILGEIIGGVKETLGNIKDGKRLVGLELENQLLRKENKKLRGMLEEVREHLALLASQATIYVKQIKKVNTKND